MRNKTTIWFKVAVCCSRIIIYSLMEKKTFFFLFKQSIAFFFLKEINSLSVTCNSCHSSKLLPVASMKKKCSDNLSYFWTWKLIFFGKILLYYLTVKLYIFLVTSIYMLGDKPYMYEYGQKCKWFPNPELMMYCRLHF